MHCDDFTRTDADRRSRLARPISRRALLQAGLGATISLYADLRPALKVAAPVALGSSGFGVHPALGEGLNGGLKGLFDRGRLGFMPGIDYANPDLSHFNSRHFWETGLVSLNPAPGWLARWTDRHGGPDNPFQAMSMDAGLSPLLRGSRNPVAAVQSPDDAQSWVPGVWGEWQDRMMEHYSSIAAQRPGAPGPAAVFAAARQSQFVARTLKPYFKDPKTDVDPLAPPVAYPGGENGEGTNGFSENLRYLAALLTLPLGIRVATVESPGDLDTHDDQAATLVRDLAQLSQGLSAFQADLEARGIADRVLTLVWTEFGRRPEENSSGGTDHGAGGIAWVVGSRARGGLLTPYPDLNAFDDEDNLKVTTDFRGLRQPARAVAGDRRRRGAPRRRPRGARRAGGCRMSHAASTLASLDGERRPA